MEEGAVRLRAGPFGMFIMEKKHDGKMSRRGFLGRAMGAVVGTGLVPALSGCYSEYENDRVQVAVPTDGILIDSCADYFNSSIAVKTYSPEMADVVNETWVKEFGLSIPEHIGIEFNASAGYGHFIREEYFDWRKMKFVKEEYLQISNAMEPFITLCKIGHELGHIGSDNEYISSLMSYRMGAMAGVHFPQFSIDTNHQLFAIANGRMLQNFNWVEIADVIMSDGGKRRVYFDANLASLFALNHGNGSFDEAHRLLRSPSEWQNINYCVNEFVDYYATRRNLMPVMKVSPSDGSESIISIQEREIAKYDLWNIVAYQVIKRNVSDNLTIDSALKPALLAGMKNAARYYVLSQFAVGDNPPYVQAPQANFYKVQPGFGNLLSSVVAPYEYNNDVPRGL